MLLVTVFFKNGNPAINAACRPTQSFEYIGNDTQLPKLLTKKKMTDAINAPPNILPKFNFWNNPDPTKMINP